MGFDPESSLLTDLIDPRKAQQSGEHLTQTGRTKEGCQERTLGQRNVLNNEYTRWRQEECDGGVQMSGCVSLGEIS